MRRGTLTAALALGLACTGCGSKDAAQGDQDPARPTRSSAEEARVERELLPQVDVPEPMQDFRDL